MQCRGCHAPGSFSGPAGSCLKCGTLPDGLYPDGAPLPPGVLFHPAQRAAELLPPGLGAAKIWLAIAAFTLLGIPLAIVIAMTQKDGVPALGLIPMVLIFAGFATASALDRSQNAPRLQVENGHLTGTSGYIFVRRESIPVAALASLRATTYWDRQSGRTNALLAFARDGSTRFLLTGIERPEQAVAMEKLAGALLRAG
jgi:hypothetical protein